MRELMLIDSMVMEEEALSWQERSLCAQTDPEAFFPEKGGSTREAKRVCQNCTVRTECLAPRHKSVTRGRKPFAQKRTNSLTGAVGVGQLPAVHHGAHHLQGFLLIHASLLHVC